MKKYFKLLLCAAFGLGAFTACEDVPAPYNIPSENPKPVNPTADYILNQTFTSSLGEFISQSESGDLAWTSSSKYGAIITGYDDWNSTGTKSNKPGVTLLLSPIINLTGCDSAYVIIDQAINYAKTTLNEDHALLIRIGDGAWATLPMTFDGLGTSFTYVSQNIQIPQEFIGKSVQIALKHIAHDSYSSTWEVKSLSVAKGQAPAGNSDTPVEGLVGSGTKDDPYDVPSTIKLIAAGPPSTKIYTKGKISKIDEIDTGSFGNATYYISNDGTTTDQLEVYRGYGLGGDKFKSTDDIKVGDEVIVYGQVIYFQNKTMEFTQGSEIYSLNGVTAGGDEPGGDAKGTGTLEDPLNSVAANNIASALASNAKTDQAYYIKGKVVSVKEQFSAQYGNASFYISDDGSKGGQFYVFRALYLGNQKWTSSDKQIKEGDEVIVYAKLTNYQGNTPETVQGDCYIYSLNGETAGNEPPTPGPAGEAKGTGTLADPYNSVAANKIASALASGAKTDEAYYLKGKVVSVKEPFSAQYGNASFYISDDGTSTDQFYIFRALYLGNQKWVNGNAQIKVGDEVIVYAKLTNYMGNTPETAQGDCYIYSINGKTEDDGSDPGEEPTPGTSYAKLSDFTNGGFETWTDGVPAQWMSTTTASTKGVLSQSSDAHSGSYSVNVEGKTSGNQRLASTELTLEAGNYTIEFYVKPEADGGSVRPGYVPLKDDGSVGSYVYGDYTNDIPAGQWTKITHTFSLDATTNVNLVIMNPKKPGKNFLIDDYTITKN